MGEPLRRCTAAESAAIQGYLEQLGLLPTTPQASQKPASTPSSARVNAAAAAAAAAAVVVFLVLRVIEDCLAN